MALIKVSDAEVNPLVGKLHIEYDQDTRILTFKVKEVSEYAKMAGIITEVFADLLEKRGIPIEDGIIEVEKSAHNMQDIFAFEAELLARTGKKVNVVVAPPTPVVTPPAPVVNPIQPVIQKPNPVLRNKI
jgi:hypothetical protein